MAGTDRQYTAIDVYQITESETGGIWGDAYTGQINDLSVLIKKAEEKNSPHYKGVAQVLLAMSFGALTDVFGDIPFSEAAKGTPASGESDGNEILNPKYDSQKQIYSGIISMLQDARKNLQASSSLLSPGSDDLIYGGELSKWVKATNVLLARYTMHQSKKPGDQEQEVLNILNNNSAFTGNAENMKGEFTGSGTDQSNPWFQFNQTRSGYISAGGKMVDTLKTMGDPRIGPFYKGDSAVGSYPGQYNTDASEIGPFYGSASSPVPLVTYVEQKFIRAEAELEVNGIAAAATPHFEEALTASLKKFEVPDPTYVSDQVSKFSSMTDKTEAKKFLMLHKWIAMFTHSEAFVDVRRTGYPELDPALNATQIPRRLPYPVEERNNNSNYPGTKPIDQKLWWQN